MSLSPCSEIRAALSTRLDGLPCDETAVQEHLVVCAACRDHESGLRHLDGAWRSLADVPLPPDLWARIEARVRPGRAGRAGRPRQWARVAALLVGVASVAALARLVEARTRPSVDRHRFLQLLLADPPETVAGLAPPELRFLRTLEEESR